MDADTSLAFVINFQIYLVAGGFENYGEGFRSSTELLVKDGVAWTLYENSLPSRMYDVASVSLNNEIFLSGQCIL